jgi:hypothetical protein
MIFIIGFLCFMIFITLLAALLVSKAAEATVPHPANDLGVGTASDLLHAKGKVFMDCHPNDAAEPNRNAPVFLTEQSTWIAYRETAQGAASAGATGVWPIPYLVRQTRSPRGPRVPRCLHGLRTRTKQRQRIQGVLLRGRLQHYNLSDGLPGMPGLLGINTIPTT